MTSHGLVLTFNKHPHDIGEREVDESDEEATPNRSSDQTLRKEDKERNDEEMDEESMRRL